MNENQTHTISLMIKEGYGKKVLNLEIPADSDIFEMRDMFKTVLTFLGYHNNSIDEIFSSEEESSPEDTHHRDCVWHDVN